MTRLCSSLPPVQLVGGIFLPETEDPLGSQHHFFGFNSIFDIREHNCYPIFRLASVSSDNARLPQSRPSPLLISLRDRQAQLPDD